ncbi:MAG: OmpA family protein, partial [Alphaproteobacteria bacterium]
AQPSGSVIDTFNTAFRSSGATTLAAAGLPAGPQPAVAAVAPAQPIGSSPSLPGPPTRQAATVYFGDGSARLSQEARETLLRVAYDYGATGGAIRIVGHASAGSGSTGAKLANLDVSMNRAVAVADALAELGVPTNAMTLEAASDNAPLAAGDPAHNRRVEIYLGG